MPIFNVKVSGGIGNQLFQYAFASSLSDFYQAEVILDASGYYEKPEHEGFLLNQLYNETGRLRFKTNPNSWIARYAFKDYSIKEANLSHPLNLQLHKLKRSIRKKRLNIIGHWQWYEFPWMNKHLLDTIQLPQPSIEQGKYVMVHVRGGDYLKTPHSASFYDTIGEEYYVRAMDAFLHKDSSTKFLLFTDDLPFAKTRLKNHFSRCSIDESGTSLEALSNMRQCQGAIVANSSFSWWGAFLQKQKGLQFAPARWNSQQIEESAFIFPPYMQRL